MRERPVSTRRAPLDDRVPFFNKAYSESMVGTASKRKKVMPGLLRAAAVRW